MASDAISRPYEPKHGQPDNNIAGAFMSVPCPAYRRKHRGGEFFDTSHEFGGLVFANELPEDGDGRVWDEREPDL